jgi:Fe-S oxidoreductase
VGIEVFDKIIDLRRGRVEAGDIPDVAAEVFEDSATRFNPFHKPAGERMLWAQGLDVPVAKEGEPVELLYWVGCAGSFDPDGQSVARAMVKILKNLNINFRVLGKRECCTGDPARRMGEEGLYQELAGRNIALLSGHSVKRVLTHCPHCFNAFLNEYPALGGNYVVEHHSQFLSRLIAEGKLRLTSGGGEAQKVTFHDPCYLGRGNGETQAPRKVLMALPQLKLVEMERHGRESFCCGAGGGSMWLDVKGETRVENLRAAEAAATGAGTVATGCPFCKSMMNAGRQSLNGGGEAMNVKDLAEMVVEAQGW